jgi:hypothetical protein
VTTQDGTSLRPTEPEAQTVLIDVLVARSGDLKRAVLDFSRHPRFDRVFRHEIRARFGRVGTGSEDELSNFFDWFIQEHRLHDGRTITEEFADSKTDLPAAEQEFLRGWRRVREGVFEVTGRDGDALLADNLIDELPYRIHTNVGPAIFDQMPTGSFLATRIVPVSTDWLISDSPAIFGIDQEADVLSLAARIATQRPDLVYVNTDKLPRGGEIQHAQYQAFVEHFGTDEITIDSYRLIEIMRGYWTRLGNPALAENIDTGWIHDSVETIGIIYDRTAGLGYYADYALACEAFADPDLVRKRRHRETIKAYLDDDAVDPVPLLRLAARHPDNASRVLRLPSASRHSAGTPTANHCSERKRPLGTRTSICRTLPSSATAWQHGYGSIGP